MIIERMWINQPSGLQQHHKLHGQNVLAVKESKDSKTARIYFTSGNIISMEVFTLVLSRGWV
jgi:hypothetical protein